MKGRVVSAVVIYSVAVAFLTNCFLVVAKTPMLFSAFIPAFVLINLFAGVLVLKSQSRRLKICCHATVLLCSFYVSIFCSGVFHIVLFLMNGTQNLLWSAVTCVLCNAVVFWNGIICAYLTSTQLGIKLRVIGIVCGMIPVANLVALYFIIKTIAAECICEASREQLNRSRRDKRLCATKYPILMVHGVFFRDTKYFNYWGRIPKELEQNGARVFYGNHQSAASVADSAAELKSRIEEILAQTGAEKVNIIAHSKGGLDSRYAISELGVAPYVASLTTVNTPHKGCLFADYLLSKIPSSVKNKVASAYNKALLKLGDPNPDFLAAVNDLTDESCRKLNDRLKLPNGIFCQSVGSVLTKARGGKFPLNFSHHLVKLFDGQNDGLVSEKSFRWGEKYILLKPSGKRGISHGDMIDLYRENIEGFDVREFFVGLVAELKEKGL